MSHNSVDILFPFTKDVKVFISCNACKRRELDSLRIKKYLLANNYIVVNDPRRANVVIFFTCAFSKEMSLDSVQKLDFYCENFDAVIVCGCFPIIGIHPIKYKENVITIKNGALSEIESYFPPLYANFKQILDGNDYYYDNDFKGNVCLIRISDGCTGNCSYCAIKKAIGTLRSKELRTILDELNSALKRDYSYIRLVADDGGAYGIDKKTDIITLLNSICGYKKIKGIEFEINPKWLLKYQEEFIQCITINSELIFKITIPLQSASCTILKKMNRNTRIDRLDLLLKELKAKNPKLFLTTHIITGYPSETIEDLSMTIEFLERHRFNQINVFPFTFHPNSPIGRSCRDVNETAIMQSTNELVEKLCKTGYVVFEATKSGNRWQHVVLREIDN